MQYTCNLLLLLCIWVETIYSYKLIRFSGGGIFFFWQIGAATYLNEHCHELKTVPVQGASAGSIAATMLATEVPFSDIADLSIQIAHENKVWDNRFGLLGIWGPLIKEFLEELVPEDLSPTALDRINILLTPRLVTRGPKLVSNFKNKDDLIEAIMASIHIPMLLDKKPWAQYKGKKYIDGGFWSYVANVQGPWPVDSIDMENDILHIDQGNDEVFMNELDDTFIMKLITPEAVYEMMQRGYDYMDCLASKGIVPSEKSASTQQMKFTPKSLLI